MSFDANAFLDMSVTDANDTKIIPIPVAEYTAVASKVEVRQWTAKDDPSKCGLTLDVTWDIDDASLKELLGRDKVTVRQGIMLDLTESGGLDMGKGRNVELGKLREGLDLNRPGEAFSFQMIPGRVAKINVKQRFDKNDAEKIYAEVKGVARI